MSETVLLARSMKNSWFYKQIRNPSRKKNNFYEFLAISAIMIIYKIIYKIIYLHTLYIYFEGYSCKIMEVKIIEIKLVHFGGL